MRFNKNKKKKLPFNGWFFLLLLFVCLFVYFAIVSPCKHLKCFIKRVTEITTTRSVSVCIVTVL